jgi:ATP-dependent Clp protease ATP-binding subunit ClpC
VRYIADRYLPDKAIDLIDEAASRVRIKSHIAPPDMKALEGKLAALRNEKEAAVAGQNFEQAAKLRDEEAKVQKEMDEARKRWESEKDTAHGQVGEEEIAEIVSGWTKIPVKRLTQDESDRLLNMEETLHKRVIGQEEAVAAVSRAIRRSARRAQRPQTADRFVPVFRPDGRWQNRALQGAGRNAVRR